MWRTHQRCLQLWLQLCSACYLCWQLILKTLHGSQLVHKESSQSIMHGKLIRYSKENPIILCLPLHICLQTRTHIVSIPPHFHAPLATNRSLILLFRENAYSFHQKKGQTLRAPWSVRVRLNPSCTLMSANNLANEIWTEPVQVNMGTFWLTAHNVGSIIWNFLPFCRVLLSSDSDKWSNKSRQQSVITVQSLS